MSSRTHGQKDASNSSALEVATGGQKHIQGGLLILFVFVTGGVSLAVEMTASRLLAPYFGSSLSVWANLIGLILLYLTIGYYVGGMVADRYPYPQVLYSITAMAALLIGLIPLIAHPILEWTLQTFAPLTIGILGGSFVSILILFTLPMVLLGMASPYALRLRVKALGKTGRAAGMLYAVSTAGSIVGTFSSILVTLPDFGTNTTFILSAALLFVTSLVGLLQFFSLNQNPL